MSDPITIVTSAASAFSQAHQIVKALLELKIESDSIAKVYQLQSLLAETQTAQLTLLEQNSALVQRKDELEKEIARFETWEAEAQRYKLHQIESGIVTYALKESVAGGEPPHWLCPDCYRKRQKSILNRIGKTNTMDHHYKCLCGYELVIFNKHAPDYVS